MAFVTVTLMDGSTAIIKEVDSEGSRQYTSGDNPTASLRYRMSNFSDSSTAYQAINTYLNQTPPPDPITHGGDGKPRFHGLPCTSITVTRREHSNLFDCVVNFSNPAASNAAGVNDNPESSICTDPEYVIPAVEDTQWSYASSLTSAHTDWGLTKTGSARYDGTTPVNFGTFIGPNSDGTFTGADIQIPQVAFSITRSEPSWYLNSTRRLALSNLTGGLNSGTWQGFGIGNVMFTGFDAQTAYLTFDNNSSNKMRYWRTTYNFLARPSSSIVVGTTTLTAAGWDTVSHCDTSVSFAGDGTAIQLPGQVDIIRCYPLIDFGAIGLTFPQ